MNVLTHAACVSIVDNRSIIGGIIIAVGLYSVVWGKVKDDPELTSSIIPSPRTKELTQQLPITSTHDISEIDDASDKITIYPQSTK